MRTLSSVLLVGALALAATMACVVLALAPAVAQADDGRHAARERPPAQRQR